LPLALFITTSPQAPDTIWLSFPLAEAAGFLVSITAMAVIGKTIITTKKRT